MPTPSSLFVSAIPISSHKLAGIKHPPPYSSFSHSFSFPLPRLHGVSRVHVVFRFFTYPLKPLTQAPISIQPIHILHAIHNHVLPNPDVSHPEFFSVDIPPGRLTSGILLHRHSIRISHIRNSSPPIFHLDISHPESFPANIPPGHITSETLPRRHSTRTSHIINYVRPTFHFLRISHTRNSARRRSTFSGYLASGIPSGRRSTFYFILRVSLGSKITFLIKLCCHFYFWQAIFVLPLFLKCFKISKESNSVIPNNGVIGIGSCKINGLWWGPNIK